MLYSKSTNSFYDVNINIEIPEDAVEVSDETYQALLNGISTGQVLTSDDDSNPVLKEATVEHEVLTKGELESLRLNDYSNPITGSDRYFLESLSLQAEGYAEDSEEVQEVKSKGLTRKAEIQLLYPYPEETV